MRPDNTSVYVLFALAIAAYAAIEWWLRRLPARPSEPGTHDIDGVRHYRDCAGNCGGSYLCEGCGVLVGWCDGAADDMPDHCDQCFARAAERGEVAP